MKYIIILISLVNILFSLTLEESKHLLNRTSFSYSQEELHTYSKFSKDEAITYLLNASKNKTIFNIPNNLKESSLTFNKNASREEKKALRKIKNQKIKELQIWWLSMMKDSRFSFREKMTLFWHNHFVSSFKVVKNPYFMYLQNKLYREESTGRFDIMLHRSSKDLAMLIYLDSNSNKKESPNENYARELLELFTLGEGKYSEQDVREAARAFTGWRVLKKKAKFIKAKKLHDNNDKTFLNQTGNFDGEDIINIVLENDNTSKFIVYKLYKEFINEDAKNINYTLINSVAKEFKKSSYDISLALKLLLLSDDFWNNEINMFKSPVELMISLYKNLELPFQQHDERFLMQAQNNLGQVLFSPPSVKGWSSGKNWLDTSSFVTRQSIIRRVIRKNKLKRKYIEIFTNPMYQLK